MSDPRLPPPDSSRGGVFDDLRNRVRLIMRLMADARVSPLLKLLPIGALAYFIIPDVILGPLDDALILWLGTYLFVELCPDDVVQEHMNALQNVVDGEWREVDSTDSNGDGPDNQLPG